MPKSKTKNKETKPIVVYEEVSKRTPDRKVYKMNDGSSQTVLYAAPVHIESDGELVEIDDTLVQSYDNRFYENHRGTFHTKFNKEQNNELFSIETDEYALTVFVENNKKGLKHPIPKMQSSSNSKKESKIVFENVINDVDYEYTLTSNRVKEDIVIKKRKATYKYAFRLKTRNLIAEYDEDHKVVYFTSTTTGEEIFHIPAPFMEDAQGETSLDIDYDLKVISNEEAILNVDANKKWINDKSRVFPVVIDPQIVRSGINKVLTQSYKGPCAMDYASPHNLKTPATNNSDKLIIELSRLNMHGENIRIKKAELIIHQHSIDSFPEHHYPILKVFKTTEDYICGDITLRNEDLLDCQLTKADADFYSFNITPFIREFNQSYDYYNYLAIQMKPIGLTTGSVKLYGTSASTNFVPKLKITYDQEYNVDAEPLAHKHSLGRLGEATIDLVRGNMLIETTDIIGEGNKMPLTIKHYYDTSKSICQYSDQAYANKISSKFGVGWKLNLIQTMRSESFIHNGISVEGYVYRNEKDECLYLCESTKPEHYVTPYNSTPYYQYVDVEEKNYIYDPIQRTLKKDKLTYHFDTYGRLTKISNEYGVNQTFYYSNNKLSYAKDGAGRYYYFYYNSNNLLTSIIAPDQSRISYEYSGNRYLKNIYFADCTATLECISQCYGCMPKKIYVKDSNLSSYYGTVYTYFDDRITSVKEHVFSSNNQIVSTGQSMTIEYKESTNTTIVYTDAFNNNAANARLKTVYCYDDDSKLRSSYVCTPDSIKHSVTTHRNINPYLTDKYSMSPISANLLKNHAFESCEEHWEFIDTTNGYFEHDVIFGASNETIYGDRFMYVMGDCPETVGDGVFQNVKSLHAGTYTFSVFVKGSAYGYGTVPSGIYVSAWTSNNNVLAQSPYVRNTLGGYVRLSTTFTITSESDVCVGILHNGSANMHINAPQLEPGSVATPYNLIQNSNFEFGESVWSFEGATTIIDSDSFDASHSLQITGDILKRQNAYQKICVKKKDNALESFTLSGWAKANSLPTDNESIPSSFRLRAEIKYVDDETNADTPDTESYVCEFSSSTKEWQYTSGSFCKSKLKAIDYITIYCDYDFNEGVALFDCIQLITNDIVLDADEVDIAKKKAIKDSEVEEDDNNEIKDAYGNDVTKTTNGTDIIGSIYELKQFNDITCYQYDDAGNNLISETDARGNVTSYEVDCITSKISNVVYPSGQITQLRYDGEGRVVSAIYRDNNSNLLSKLDIEYNNNDNVVCVSRVDGFKYIFTYDEFNRFEEFIVDGVETPIIKYEFNDKNGKISKFTYANGQYKEFDYDSLGRMITTKWYSDTDALISHLSYEYDQYNNISKVYDNINNVEESYCYYKDVLSQILKTKYNIVNGCKMPAESSSCVLRTHNTDGKCETEKMHLSNGRNYVTEYDNSSNKQTAWNVTIGGRNIKFKSQKDDLDRKLFEELQTGTTSLYRKFSYVPGVLPAIYKTRKRVASVPTTNLIERIDFNTGRYIQYSYDESNNVLEMFDSTKGTTKYHYDTLGQLISEVRNNDIISTMTYDDYGNILTKNGKEYTYDTVWKDKLISYDGSPIVYDDCGNPLSLLGATLSWKWGKKLASFTNSKYICSFDYDSYGVRTSKVVNGVVHNYLLDGYKILAETWGNNALIPLYDNDDVVGIIYNNTVYYFVKNQFNDILEILDVDGNQLVEYTYDAWGKCNTLRDASNNSIGTINPYRYRGYYYDQETELYYLQTRYYSPELGRFLNCDSVNFIKKYSTALSYNNLFPYASNCPNMYTDKYGLCTGFEQTKIDYGINQIYDHGMSQTTPSVLLEPGLDVAVDIISKILDIGPWIVRSIAGWFE